MQTAYKRTELGGGVAISKIADSKFKTNSVYVRFLTEYKREDAAALALIPSVITSSSEDYPTGTLLNKKLNALYGTTVTGSASQIGGMYEVTVCIDYLSDVYALDGDKIAEPASQILLGCIFRPALENGGFAAAEFEMRRKDLLDSIDAEINDKVSYALSEAFKTVYEGEPSASKHYGSREEVESVTPQKAYEVYKKLLSEAKVEISLCGHGDFDEAEKLLSHAFDTARTSFADPKYFDYSAVKADTAYAEEKMDVSQANLVLAFKPKTRDLRVAQVMSCVYGGSAFSKLFANVREKMSLCYFCQSIYSETKGTMFVVSAVEFDNIDKAKDEIIHQLSLIANGEFTDDELANAKLYLANAYSSSEDRISSIDLWYFRCNQRNEILTPQEYAEKLCEVTREQVIQLAAQMKLDTVFVLRNIGEQ